MKLDNHTDERALLEKLRDGDETAFTEIYNRYWEKMADYAIRLSKSEEEGADIVPEIFVSLWNGLEVLEVKDTLASHLIKSTRNLSLRFTGQNLTRYDFLERLTVHMQNGGLGFEDLLSTKHLQEHIGKTV